MLILKATYKKNMVADSRYPLNEKVAVALVLSATATF
jgi:hypothetical protein